MEYIADAMATLYNITILIPNWLLYVLTGAMGSVVIGLLHRSPKTPAKAKPQPNPRVVISEPVSLPATTAATEAASPKVTKRGGAKTKKSGKK
jgi:hypothetical protein